MRRRGGSTPPATRTREGSIAPKTRRRGGPIKIATASNAPKTRTRTRSRSGRNIRPSNSSRENLKSSGNDNSKNRNSSEMGIKKLVYFIVLFLILGVIWIIVHYSIIEFVIKFIIVTLLPKNTKHSLLPEPVKKALRAIDGIYQIIFGIFMKIFGPVLAVFVVVVGFLWICYFFIKNYAPLRHMLSPPIRDPLMKFFIFDEFKDRGLFGFVNILLEYFMANNRLGKSVYKRLNTIGEDIQKRLSRVGFIYDENCEIETERQEIPRTTFFCPFGYRKDKDVCFRNVDVCKVKTQDLKQTTNRLKDFSKSHKDNTQRLLNFIKSRVQKKFL